MTYPAPKNSRRTPRIAAAAALVAAAVLSLFSCTASVKPAEATEEESAVVGRVAGRDVCYDELRYLAINYREELSEKYGDVSVSSPDADAIRAELRDLVVAALGDSDYYAVTAMADEYYQGGSSKMLSEEKITEAVADEINRLATDLGGRKKYFAELEANHMNDRLMRFYLSCEQCATELIYILKNDLGIIPASEEDLRAALDSPELCRTNHLYLQGLTEENRQKCEEARRRLLASDNREMEIILIKSVYRDADVNVTTSHGAYFSRYTSDYGDAYEKAAFDLSVGQVSEVIEGEDGYFVILRLAPESDYVLRNFEELASGYVYSRFNRELDLFRKNNSFEFNEFGAGIDLLAIN